MQKHSLHRGQFNDTLRYYLCRFMGVGKVSEPAFRRDGSWPFGRPSMILVHTFVSSSEGNDAGEFGLNLQAVHLLVPFCLLLFRH